MPVFGPITSLPLVDTPQPLVNKLITAGTNSYSINAPTGAPPEPNFPNSAFPVNLEWNQKLAAAAPVAIPGYAITGTAVTFRIGRELNLSINTGNAYALTGTAATLTKAGVNKTVVAAGSSYAMSGTATSLEWIRHFNLVAGASSYEIAGLSIGLTWSGIPNKVVIASGSSYAITGSPATFTKPWLIPALSESYVITGGAVGLTESAADPRLFAEVGTYAVTGSAAGLAVLGLDCIFDTGIFDIGIFDHCPIIIPPEPPEGPSLPGGSSRGARRKRVIIRNPMVEALAKLAAEKARRIELEILAAEAAQKRQMEHAAAAILLSL